MALTKVSGDILDTGIVVAGVTTSTNFKTGTSNLHSSGIEIAGINVLGADTPIGAGVTIYNSGGADFTGVVTATRFVGQADISGGSITATTGTFSGDVSIGGTLTYQDVTNVDSTGIATARVGLDILSGGLNIVGLTTGLHVSGVSTFTSNIRINDYVAHSGVDSLGVKFYNAGAGNNGTYIGLGAEDNGTSSGTNHKTFQVFRQGSSVNRVNIDASGNLNVVTGKLQINDIIEHIGDSNTKIRFPAADTFAVETAGSEILRVTATGEVNIGDTSNNTWIDSTLKVRKDQNAVTKIAVRNENQGSSASSAIVVNAYGNSWMFDCGSAAKNSNALTIRLDATASSNQGTEKLKIDTSGHITPGAANTQDLGSASKEFRHLYIGDSGRVRFGSDQDMHVYHDNTHGYVSNRKNNLYVEAPNFVMITSTDTNGSNQQTSARFLRAGASDLYHANTLKFSTSSTGVSVTGEVAATQDYPTIRPTLDLNFAAVKKLDSRITYSRTGPASYIDEFGKLVLVGDNVPRFDHDPDTRESKGLLIEESRTNLMKSAIHPHVGKYSYGSNSNGAIVEVSDDVLAPDGSAHTLKLHWTNYTANQTGYIRVGNQTEIGTLGAGTYGFSFFVKRGTDGKHNMEEFLAGTATGIGDAQHHFTIQEFSPASSANVKICNNSAVTIDKYPDGWYRLSGTITTSGSSNPDNTGASYYVLASSNFKTFFEAMPFYHWGFQLESGSFPTSYIGGTVSATTTRGADLALIDGEEFTDFFNQDEGTINCAYWLGNDNVGLRVFQINDSNNSVIDIVAGSGSGAGGYGYVSTGGSAQANGGQSSTNASNLNTLHVTTLAYKTNDVAGINIKTGVLTTDTSATLDGAYNRVTFYQGANSGDQLNGHLQRVQYYPKRLPDNQLKNLNNQ
mgnify:CR=1 FL=1